MNDLISKKCVPCEGGVPAMPRDEAEQYLDKVKNWTLNDGMVSMISREFEFKNFVEAMAFVNKVADLAESEGHHPNIHVFYNKVRFELTTHAIRGLSENDFILAAKIDLI